MSRPSQHFYDDAGTELGIGHAAERIGTEAEPSRNYLLGDEEWLDRNNERLERELRQNQQELPARVNERDGMLVDRDVEEQLEAEFQAICADPSTKKMAEPDQRKLARERVLKRQQRQPKNAGAYDAIRAEERRLRRECPNLSAIEVTRRARESVEARVPHVITGEAMSGTIEREETPDQKYLGDTIENLMQAPSGEAGGGSKSRKRGKKKGTWICKECKLEYCEHRPKRGRPAKEKGQCRPHRRRARMTDATLAEIEASGFNESDALAIYAQARRERRPLDEVEREWRLRNGSASQVSAA